MVGSWADSLDDSKSIVGFEADSASAIGSALGFCFGTGFAIEGCFQPATSQSTEGNFQHYAHLLCSMYTTNEDTPFGSARILHRCNSLD